MSITMVNGYACQTCAEIAKAKRGENPAAKASDPKATDPKLTAKQVSSLDATPAVTFGGALVPAPPGSAAQPASMRRLVDRIA